MDGGRSLAWVMVGGMFGAAARWLVNGWVQRRTGAIFPWGTLAINLSGCLILGVFAGLRGSGRYALPGYLTPAVGIGFVGAYTTFSTFAVDTVGLMTEGSWGLAWANVGASVAAGLALAALGVMLGRRL